MDFFEQLCDAIYANQLEEVKNIIENNVIDLNQHNGLALKMASKKENTELVMYLVNKGINITDNQEWFDNLVYDFNLEQIQHLWAKGARGNNPLVYCDTDNEEVFTFLVQHIHESHFENDLGFWHFLNKKNYDIIKKYNYEFIFSTPELQKQYQDKFEVFPYFINEKTLNEIKNKNYENIKEFTKYDELSLDKLKELHLLLPEYLNNFFSKAINSLLNSYELGHVKYVVENITSYFNSEFNERRMSSVKIDNLEYILKHTTLNPNFTKKLFDYSINYGYTPITDLLIENRPKQYNDFAFICNKYKSAYIDEIRQLTQITEKEKVFLEACQTGNEQLVNTFINEKENVNIENSALLFALAHNHQTIANSIALVCELTDEQMDIALKTQNKEVISILLNRGAKLNNEMVDKIALIEDEALFHQLVKQLSNDIEKINLYELHKEMSTVAKIYFSELALKDSEKDTAHILNNLAHVLSEEVNFEPLKELTKKLIICSANKEKSDETRSNSLAFLYINQSNFEMLQFCIDNHFFKLNSKALFINTTLNIKNAVSEPVCKYLIELAPNDKVKEELITFALINNHITLAQENINNNKQYTYHYLELQKLNKNYTNKSTLDYLLNKIYKNIPNELIKIEQYALEKSNKQIINELNILKEHEKLNDLFVKQREDKPIAKKRKI